MRIIIILLAAIAIYSAAFYRPVCEHVFTVVEKANVKVERPEFSGAVTLLGYYSWPTGLLEGKELICVKCFHKQKQVLDYGGVSPTNIISDSILKRFGSCCDTASTFNSGGIYFIKGDSLKYSLK